MAIPTSPSVVVLENDISVFVPNVDSSVVGVVGFANKGPTDKATLITSQENLIRQFGRPSTPIPGQGLEGALEILEATNQLYFVRAAGSGAQSASTPVPVGACPTLLVSGYDPAVGVSTLNFTATNNVLPANAGYVEVTGSVGLTSSTNFRTADDIIKSVFDSDLTGDQPVFSFKDPTVDGVFIASKFAGQNARLTVSSLQNDGDNTIGFRAVDVFGAPAESDGAVTDLTGETASGFTSSSVDLRFYSRYPGTGYNFKVDKDGASRGFSVELDNISVKDRLVVNSDGIQAEAFDNLELSPSSSENFETVLTSDDITAKSEYIYAELLNGGVSFEAPNDFGASSTKAGYVGNIPAATDVAAGGTPSGTPRFIRPVAGTFVLSGGDSGYQDQESDTNPDVSSTDDAAALIGTAAEKTGMHALDDDTLNISLALVPGITEDTVQNALVTLAESSKNFLAFVSPPYALGEVQDAIDWINGKSPTTRTAALNSSFAASYWPWVQVFNTFEGQEEWFDPTIFAARQCVFTDAVNEPWFAPAGFRRGRLTKPTDIEQKILNQGDRDALYSNAINPIVKDPTQGIVIFGQKTTQRLPTALDRVNVRRLMIFIRKVLLEIGKPFQFEPNDQFTWEQVEETINPFIDDLLARRAIVEGLVRCDSTTNTPSRVDRNELWCSVTIKPTKAAETIVFEVNLTNQSASIN